MTLIPNILSLCDKTGNWSRPYAEAGYHVIQVDLAYGQDVRLLCPPAVPIRGIIAQPPCTHLAGSGARWWEAKGEAALFEALAIADACLRFVAICRPAWWVMENPVGRLARFIGPPRMTFNPCEYGGWIDGGGRRLHQADMPVGRFRGARAQARRARRGQQNAPDSAWT